MAIQFFTSKGESITNKLEFEPTSLDMFSSLKLLIISSESPVSASIESRDFSFFEVNGDDILFSNTFTPIKTDYSDSHNNTKSVYELDITFNPKDKELDKDSKLDVTIGGRVFQFTLIGSLSEVDPKLVVLLQNFKKFISNDYVDAFRESTFNSPTDYELYNRKIREYLINIHNLSTINGTYKGLESALKYFGYGELLTLREYWYSENKYKSTPIGGEVIQHLDKSLAGFKKSNQMSLIYQINEQSGIDDDGLPIYSNVFALTDEILLKMWALQRVLEKDFLSINTHIVDIIGEFQSVVGIELTQTLNDATISSYNITDNLNKEVKFELNSTDIKIMNHKVILEPFALDVINDTDIEFIVEDTTFDKDFFTVLRLANQFDEFDMLTKYYVGEFGLISFKLDFDLSRYQLISYKIFEDTVSVFESKKYYVSELNESTLRFGIKEEGEYKIMVELIDHYGGVTHLGDVDTIKVSYKELNVQLGVVSSLDSNLTQSGESLHMLDSYTTYESSEGKSIPDANNDLDIMVWDQANNDPSLRIARKYAENYDKLTSKATPNQLNRLTGNYLKGIPCNVWSTNHTVILIKPGEIGDQIIINGNIIDYLVDSELEFQTLINRLHDSNSPLLEDFDIDFIEYSNDDINVDTVIRLISKETGYLSSFVDIEDINSEYYYCFDSDLYSSKMSEASPLLNNTSGDMVITIDGVEEFNEYVDFNTNVEVFEFFSTLPYFETFNTETLKIFSNHDFKIQLNDITIISHVKAKHLGKIHIIPNASDVQIGQPVFASIYDTFDIKDIKWTLKDALTNKIITQQNSLAFRWLFNLEGVYSLVSEFKYRDTEYEFNIDGAFIVKAGS